MRAALGLREPLTVPKSPAVTTFSYVTFTSAVAACHAERWLSEGIRWSGGSEGGEWSWTDVDERLMYSVQAFTELSVWQLSGVLLCEN